MTNLIKFQNQNIEIITVNEQPYMRVNHIGLALNLAKPNIAVQKIYRKHRNEFTNDMMLTIELPTNGGKQLCTVYSPRGAALIAMYAQTPVAAQFRAFILDVLEGKQSTKAQNKQVLFLLSELLRARPEWQKILHYNRLGLSSREISKLIGRHRETVQKEMRKMRDLGLPVKVMQQGGNQQLVLSLEG